MYFICRTLAEIPLSLSFQDTEGQSSIYRSAVKSLLSIEKSTIHGQEVLKNNFTKSLVLEIIKIFSEKELDLLILIAFHIKRYSIHRSKITGASWLKGLLTNVLAPMFETFGGTFLDKYFFFVFAIQNIFPFEYLHICTCVCVVASNVWGFPVTIGRSMEHPFCFLL